MTAELIRICDLAGRPRGSGFVADDRGTVLTSHEAVDGLARLVLHGPAPGERTWLAGASDVIALPGLGLALVRSDGLGVRPLPVAPRGVIAPGTYVRLSARGWRQARVLGPAGAAGALPALLDLAIGTDGRDALRLGGEPCGGPVLDARTGAVLAVLCTAPQAEHRSGALAVPLAAAAAADPGGPLAALLERNAATVPGYGPDLNLAGALQLTGTTLGAALATGGPEPVDRPAIAAELDAFTAGDRPVLALVGRPGTGRTTALAALAARRARGPRPAPTLWLRGADLRAEDTSLADAVARALAEAARILEVPDLGPGAGAAPTAEGAPPTGNGPAAGSAAGPASGPAPASAYGSGPTSGHGSGPAPASAPGPVPGSGPGWVSGSGCASGFGSGFGPGAGSGPGSGYSPASACGSASDSWSGAASGSASGLGSAFGSGAASGLGAGSGFGVCPGSGCGSATFGYGPASGPGSGFGSGSGPGSGFGSGSGHGSGSGDGFGCGVVPGGEVGVGPASAGGLAGRGLLVVLDGPEEMPPRLAGRAGPWTAATAAWLEATGARLAVAARPEYWESAGRLYPQRMLHLPARPARRLPPAVPVGDLAPEEAAQLRARLGIPAEAVAGADARHPLTLRLLAEIRAAGVTAGSPSRDEVFAAHLDLLCLRVAVRVSAALPQPRRPDGTDTAGVYGPGAGRLAVRVAGRVHEAARRCLGPGQGQLDRASFEELFPWRSGWASAVLTEGLLVPAGEGYRFAHEELADWVQAAHLDLPAALDTLGRDVPRHRIGPVLEALCLLPPGERAAALERLVAPLDGAAGPEPRWWAARLLAETLLRAPDATPYLPVLHALAGHPAGHAPSGEHGPAPSPPAGSAAYAGALGNPCPPGTPVGGPTAAGRPDTPSGNPDEGDEGEFGAWFWTRVRIAEEDRFELLRRLVPRDHRLLDAAARRLVRAPLPVQPLLCGWFRDERRLLGRPGATVATAAQALLHTHRGLAVDDLAEALVTAAHPRADELLAVLAEDEPSALSRAVDRWAHDERPGRRVAAAAYGPLTAPHVRTPADRELLRYAAQALLARPGDVSLHGSALGMLLRDPQVRARYLPEALACFRDPARGRRLPAAALVAALPVLPDPDAVFAVLRERADGEVVRALAALTTPGLARRAADLVRDHLARCPQDAAHAAGFVERRLEQGLAAAPVLRPLVRELLGSGPPPVRAALAGVLAAPGTESSYTLRGELAEELLRAELDPSVLDAFLGALAAGAGTAAPDRTRDLLRRTGRQLLRAPGGPAVFERRTVELARSEPAFGALVASWLEREPQEAAALLGPGARRTVGSLAHSASPPDDADDGPDDADDGPRAPAWQS